MKPLQSWPLEAVRLIDVVYCDIDDTLTTDGRLPATAFDAMWRLHNAGVRVVPVTGRPAGWCDMIARLWPVAGIVGENGAFYFFYDPALRRLRQRFILDADARAGLQLRLQQLKTRILEEVPGAGVASDQPYRIHDLAIDFCEDVPPLESNDIDRIVALFREAGATAKVSSIHVNGWFGDYDKLGMIRLIATEVVGAPLDEDTETAGQRCSCYVGDSPNDEPAFRFFRNSIGVANVMDHLGRMTHPPAFVTNRAGGQGFAEVAEAILSARAAR